MIDKSQFLKRYRIDEETYEAAACDWEVLKAIHQDHVDRLDGLEATGHGIANRLRQVPSVHSLKIRVKHPEHLLEKIVRKHAEDESREIRLENYRDEITDLIGVRALHLFKGQWEPIHDYIKETWDLHEEPKAYVRRGDSEELRARFEKKGCEVVEHPAGYRSVHYLVECSPTKERHVAEVQVRTIFEEGWSEIDHQVRYPYDVDNQLLNQFLVIFNRLAGSADEMGSFVRHLKGEFEEATLERERLRDELTEKIEQLEIERSEKEELSRRVDELSGRYFTAESLRIGPDGNQFPTLSDSILGPDPSAVLYRPTVSKTCVQCGREYEDTISTDAVHLSLCPDCIRAPYSVSASLVFATCEQCGKQYQSHETGVVDLRPRLCPQCRRGSEE